MANTTRFASLALLWPLCLACNPEFDNRFSTVDAPRVLAVQSQPAQAAPGRRVTYRLLVADENGTVATPAADWAYCTRAKPVSELNDVSQDCFGTGERVLPFAMGADASGTLPPSGCRQFGPDIPMTQPGEPAARPTDADSTGGYYQPVILTVGAGSEAISTLAETRLSCGLANSTGTQFEQYQLRAKLNENPELTQVVAVGLDGVALENGAAAAFPVARGQTLTLRASWPSCPTSPSCGDGLCTSGESALECAEDCTSPVGCRGPEEYAYLDPARGVVVPRHEAMRVSWFATRGEFRDDHTGRPEEDFALTSSDNTWRAPDAPADVFMWVVLRDARGGVDWQSFRLAVE